MTMNINKLNLNGVEYNLTDKDAQSKITELQKNTYNKTEVDNLVNAIDNKVDGINLDNYYTKAEVDTAIENVDVTDQLSEYAKKSELPTEYDDTAVKARISTLEAIDHSQYLTEHQDISNLAPKSYVDGKVADLVNSAPETLDTLGELATAITEHKEVTDALDAAITNKVDKVAGKGLSTNDYTTAEKNKLAATPSFWVGSQAEYDAIANKDTNTFYYITEE